MAITTYVLESIVIIKSVGRWPFTWLKNSAGVNTVRFSKNVWPFYNMIHKKGFQTWIVISCNKSQQIFTSPVVWPQLLREKNFSRRIFSQWIDNIFKNTFFKKWVQILSWFFLKQKIWGWLLSLKFGKSK